MTGITPESAGGGLREVAPYTANKFRGQTPESIPGGVHGLPFHAQLAIIAYLRTLTPIENDVPDHQLDFPLSLIVNVIPLARRTAHR